MKVQEENVATALSLPLAFPIGLPGFETYHTFHLVGLGPAYGPYLGLRCAADGGPTFVVVQPSEIGITLELEIDDFHQALLGIREASEVLVMLIATLRTDGAPPTVNTQAPLVINVTNWKVAQVSQPNTDYQLDQESVVEFYDPGRVTAVLR